MVISVNSLFLTKTHDLLTLDEVGGLVETLVEELEKLPGIESLLKNHMALTGEQ